MKINKTGNQYSELLNKVAQSFGPQQIPPGPEKTIDEEVFPQDNYVENDIIGALTRAVQNVKAADWVAAIKAIDAAKGMIDRYQQQASPGLLNINPSEQKLNINPSEGVV